MEINIDLQRCINILKRGGLLVAPSDTVYGLVCDARSESAVKKLFAVKNRPWGKPISVFTDGFAMIDTLVELKDHKALLKTLLPGPFTIILPSKHTVCSFLESEQRTLGVRFPCNKWLIELVTAFGGPLTATSANVSGKSPHYDANEFFVELSDEKRKLIDYVVDVGRLPRNKPSTIIDLSGKTLQFLRRGDVVPIAEQRFTSGSAQETKRIASSLGEKYASFIKHKPLVFILEGEMGVGKTVFAQGLGEFLDIEAIVSPTYVVYYEYPVNKNGIKMFLHADLFNIQDNEEYSHLGLESYLKKQTVICIEWGERIGSLFNTIKEKAKVMMVEMKYREENSRTISIKEL